MTLRKASLKRRRRRPKPGDDPRYLAWIREQPCIVPGCGASWCEAAHLHSGLQGMGLKSPDRFAIPLCAEHHRTGKLAHHALGSDRAFAEAHGLDLEAEMKRLREAYERSQV